MEEPETLERLIGVGRERLYPGLTNPNWLVMRKRRRLFEQWFAKLATPEMNVLDVGGRIQPYRPLLADRFKRYISIDTQLTPLVNVLGRGEELPFRENTFDLVICTQVLQYVPDPKLAIAEIHRVLKSEGHLFLSVPAAWPRDADHECWRFLPAGLRHLLSSFHHVEIRPEGGSVAGFFRTVNACLNIFVRYRLLRLLFQKTVCPVTNLSGLLFDRLSGNDQFAVNYSVLARK